MEEGKRLSIKQSNMETTIKKLRGQVKELEASHTQTAAKLAAEEAKMEAATQARQKAEAAAAAALQQHKADTEQQKQHFGNLLKEAHKSQVRLHACQWSRAHSSHDGFEHVRCNGCISSAAEHDLLLYEPVMALCNYTGRPAFNLVQSAAVMLCHLSLAQPYVLHRQLIAVLHMHRVAKQVCSFGVGLYLLHYASTAHVRTDLAPQEEPELKSSCCPAQCSA